jgi:hypothetical protein
MIIDNIIFKYIYIDGVKKIVGIYNNELYLSENAFSEWDYTMFYFYNVAMMDNKMTIMDGDKPIFVLRKDKRLAKL